MPNFSGTKSNCSLMPIQRKGKKVGSMLNSSPFASSTQGSFINGVTLIIQFIDTPSFPCHPSYTLKSTLNLHSQLPYVVCDSSSNRFWSLSSSVFNFFVLAFSKLYSFQIFFSPKIGPNQFKLDQLRVVQIESNQSKFDQNCSKQIILVQIHYNFAKLNDIF